MEKIAKCYTGAYILLNMHMSFPVCHYFGDPQIFYLQHQKEKYPDRSCIPEKKLIMLYYVSEKKLILLAFSFQSSA